MGVLAVLLSSWEFLKKSWEFLGVFWEFLEHSNTSVVIAQIVLTVHRSPLVAPGLKRFRKTIHSHTSQFSLLRQMLMVGQHAEHQITEQVIATPGDIPAVHQHATRPQPVTSLFYLRRNGQQRSALANPQPCSRHILAEWRRYGLRHRV